MIDAVFEQYREEGYERVVVDWTDLVEFYERLGLEPWLAYEYCERSLTPGAR